MRTVTERLDHVRAQTRCPTKSAFAEWIGVSSAQTVQQWETRDSLPGNQALAIHQVTGANVAWLLGADAEPFPNGPVLYEQQDMPPQAAERLTTELRAAWTLLAALCATVSRTGEGAAGVLLTALSADRVAPLLAASPEAGRIVEMLRRDAEASAAPRSRNPQKSSSRK